MDRCSFYYFSSLKVTVDLCSVCRHSVQWIQSFTQLNSADVKEPWHSIGIIININPHTSRSATQLLLSLFLVKGKSGLKRRKLCAVAYFFTWLTWVGGGGTWNKKGSFVQQRVFFHPSIKKYKRWFVRCLRSSFFSAFHASFLGKEIKNMGKGEKQQANHYFIFSTHHHHYHTYFQSVTKSFYFAVYCILSTCLLIYL